jgi:hypothetical protein
MILSISPPANYERFYRDMATTETAANSFLLELQRAISKNDPKAVAQLCEYPLTVYSSDKQMLIDSRAELIREYSRVFSEEVKRAILGTPKPMLQGWHGYRTKDGEVWFDSVYGTDVFRVRTINVSVSFLSSSANK